MPEILEPKNDDPFARMRADGRHNLNRRRWIAGGVGLALITGVVIAATHHDKSHAESTTTTTTASTTLPKSTITTALAPETYEFRIPGSLAYRCVVDPNPYIVEPKDSVWSIAVKHHKSGPVSVAAEWVGIQALNEEVLAPNPSDIHSGTKLKVFVSCTVR